MYYLCKEYYNPITLYYIANCVSWIPRLTLLDFWMCSQKGNSFVCRELTVFGITYVKEKVAQLCWTLCSPMDYTCPWNSPGWNTRVGSLSLLQENLPNPGVKPRSPTLRIHCIASCIQLLKKMKVKVNNVAWNKILIAVKPIIINDIYYCMLLCHVEILCKSNLYHCSSQSSN